MKKNIKRKYHQMKQQQQQSKCSDSRAGGSGDDQVSISDVDLMTG